MSSMEDVAINQINAAAMITFYVLSVVNFVLGAIGLIFNLFIFTRPFLRRQPCSFYFFSSTWFNLFIVLVVIPIRLLWNVYGIEMANYNLGYCKIQTFSIYTARTISCWLIAFASIDRYLNSSDNVSLRRLSTLRSARLSVGIISLVVFILYSHMIRYYEISKTSDRFGNITPLCNGQQGIYRSFLGFWYMIFYSLFPSFIMLFFGFLTVHNLRQRRRLAPGMIGNNRIVKRTDAELLRMLAGQVSMIIICTLPFCIDRIYAALTTNLIKNTLQISKENFAFQIVGAMSYSAHSTSFYMYTLSGTIFRREFLKIIRFHWRPNPILLQRNNDVIAHPISVL